MIHILIRYLGIKTKLLDLISSEVEDLLPNRGTVLDMFAGSTIVAQRLSANNDVVVNDIQEYSYVVGKALIEIDKSFDYKKIDVNNIINSNSFRDNYNYLSGIFSKQLQYEKDLISYLLDNLDDYQKLQEYKLFYEKTPHVNGDKMDYVHPIFKGTESFFSRKRYLKLQKNNSDSFYELFTLKYTTPYFSLEQAVFIDSFRYSLEKNKTMGLITDTEYYIYLSLLIYALNNIVTSVGDHFAQPQQFKIDDNKMLKREVKKIITKKSLSIKTLMEDKQIEFNNLIVSDYGDNLSLCYDYKELFYEQNHHIMNKVDVIYIDPPYTNAHYSRFYHILETLVKYDYPDTEYHGRYRTDRYQSPFGIKSKAHDEFDTMISLCRTARKSLVISYSDTKQCILSKSEIKEICEKYYQKVIVKEIDYLYRNFGQQPNKVKGNELIIRCEV